MPPCIKRCTTRGMENWNQGAPAWRHLRGREPSLMVRLAVRRGIGGRKRNSPSGGSAKGILRKL